jgi:hypothetical protein
MRHQRRGAGSLGRRAPQRGAAVHVRFTAGEGLVERSVDVCGRPVLNSMHCAPQASQFISAAIFVTIPFKPLCPQHLTATAGTRHHMALAFASNLVHIRCVALLRPRSRAAAALRN